VVSLGKRFWFNDCPARIIAKDWPAQGRADEVDIPVDES
jgi:hypothetical protein